MLFISSSTAWVSKVNCLVWSPCGFFFPSCAVNLSIYLFINLLIRPSPAQGVLPRTRRAKYKEGGDPCINLPGNLRTLDEFCSAFIAADNSPEDLRMCHGTAASEQGTGHSKGITFGMLGRASWHRDPIPGPFQVPLCHRKPIPFCPRAGFTECSEEIIAAPSACLDSQPRDYPGERQSPSLAQERCWCYPC